MNALRWYFWHLWHGLRSPRWVRDGDDAVCTACDYRVEGAGWEVCEVEDGQA